MGPLTDLWDQHHPSEVEVEDELEPSRPTLPTIDHLPEVVDYSIRAPGDWVVSGPTQPGGGNGRYFSSELEAFRWACEKYGRTRVSRVEAGPKRWAVLVRAVR